MKTYMTYIKTPLKCLDLIALKNQVSAEAQIGPLITSLSHKPEVILWCQENDMSIAVLRGVSDLT